MFRQGSHEPVQLGGRQSRGGAASYINRPYLPSRLGQGAACGGNLPFQGLQEGFHQLEGPAHPGGDEGAVGASGGTEGNPHVEGHLMLV